MREIEIKIRTKDLETVKSKLLELGCELSEPLEQHDVVYSYNNDVSLWQKAQSGSLVLRIRREKKGSIFTLKKQLSNELDNIELETEVADPEVLHKIFLEIGYQPQVEVKKIRQKGRFKDYEICLDTVEKLGSFVELEKLTGDDADPAAVKEELFQALESLGLSRDDEELRGYDTQVFQVDHA